MTKPVFVYTAGEIRSYFCRPLSCSFIAFALIIDAYSAASQNLGNSLKSNDSLCRKSFTNTEMAAYRLVSALVVITTTNNSS